MIINLAKIRFGGTGGAPAKPEDFFEETYVANGDYDVVPEEGHVFSGGTITVAVPSDQKPEDEFTELYEANGVYDITPESGHVFSAGQIEVDVHPTDKLTRTYTENNTYEISGEWTDAEIEVDVHPSDKLTRTYTENDTYEISGEWTDAEITVAVPVPTEEALSETITENGLHTFTPTAGSVFSSVEIEADVHPENSLSLTITESGSYSSSDEFSGYEINVDVEGPKTEETLTQTITTNGTQIYTPTAGSVYDSAVITVNVPGITPTGTINISANGTYDVTDKATAIVAVGGTDYRYKTGTPDTIGLAAIGWTTDDIGYYGANTPHYAWENGDYTVSQENINLYSLDDPQPSLYKDDPDVTFVPNKNMRTYFYNVNRPFAEMYYIKGIPWFNISGVAYIGYMFYKCRSLTTIPQLDTSSATNMTSMFQECSSLQTIPQLDTSNVENMRGMFYKCNSLQAIPQLDTSKVTNMRQMFYYCSSLQTIPQLDTSKVTDMNATFAGCNSLQAIPQLNVSRVTIMTQMFHTCEILSSIPDLNMSSATDAYQMFYNCGLLQSVGVLDTSSATNMSQMFYYCSSLESVAGIDFSSLTSYPSRMFGINSLPYLTHFIVNGKINFTWNDNYCFNLLYQMDYDSIKSILEAMNRTDNTNAKEMKFYLTMSDPDGELAALVASCTAKNWTITGLTLTA